MRQLMRGICIGIALLLVVGTVSGQDETVPEAMIRIDEGGYDILNILLLGADTANSRNNGRTDALMVVSINRTVGTVSLLSIPRDLWVYVPGYGMDKINTAYATGENANAQGAALLRETIEYNLGLVIDYHARVDFSSFTRLIDDLGGIEVAVDCLIEDWRLKEPTLDPTLEDNWELFTLPIGVQHMNGDLALWYARSRRTTSDFDRGRRQQAIIRAIWSRVRALDMWEQLTDVYAQVTELVSTDLGAAEMISLASIASTMDTSRMASFTFRPNIEVTFGTSEDGQSILLPVRDAIIDLENQLMQPPTQSALAQEHARVEIINASGVNSFGQVAAERLAWEGFVPTVSDESAPYQQSTTIYDYTGQRKGSSLGVLQAALQVSSSNIVVEPDADRTVDFRVVIGNSLFACTHNAMPEDPLPAVDGEGG